MKNLYILMASIFIVKSISCVDFTPTNTDRSHTSQISEVDDKNLSSLLREDIANLISAQLYWGPNNASQFKIFLHYADGDTRIFVLKWDFKSKFMHEGWKLCDVSGDKAHTLLPKHAPVSWLKIVNAENKFYMSYFTRSSSGSVDKIAAENLNTFVESKSKIWPEFFPQGFKPQIDSEGNFIIK